MALMAMGAGLLAPGRTTGARWSRGLLGGMQAMPYDQERREDRQWGEQLGEIAANQGWSEDQVDFLRTNPEAGRKIIGQQLFPTEDGDRKTLKSADGFHRYVDNTQRVFPGVQKAASEGSEFSFKDQFQAEGALRDDFSRDTKDFVKVRDSYQRIVKSGENPSAAGDLAMIFNYMKVLDPGSVVRESEFATAESAAAWLQRSEELGIDVPMPIAAGIRKLKDGYKLSPEQRVDFMNRAGMLYQGQEAFFMEEMNRYRGLAESYQFNPDRVVHDLRLGFDPKAAAFGKSTDWGEE